MTLIEAVLPKDDNKVLALTRDIILVLAFALLTGIAAKLKIEIGPVPITMQTFTVLLAGALLGSKKGALSQITYLLIGLSGLPWFARGGGMSYVMSPTFGYVIGFVLAAFAVGWLCEKGWDRNLKKAVLVMLIGNIVIYLPGLFWLAKFIGFGKVLKIGFYPFILGDILKLILAGAILPFLWGLIRKEKD